MAKVRGSEQFIPGLISRDRNLVILCASLYGNVCLGELKGQDTYKFVLCSYRESWTLDGDF